MKKGEARVIIKTNLGSDKKLNLDFTLSQAHGMELAVYAMHMKEAENNFKEE